MSYDIYLKDADTDKPIILDEPHQLRGGTYAVGGTTEAHLNITYNYAEYYYEYIDKKLGIRFLYDMQACDASYLLVSAIHILGIERSDDYWEATQGNAGAALLDLLTLGFMYPEGIWHGD